jgi:predicted transposase/invertase (TIGR01784 family)
MRERITVYAAKLLAEQLSSGEEYKTVHRVISVLITDFELLDKTRDYHTWFRLRDPGGKIALTDVLEVHTLELSKIPAREDGQKVWPWLKFLDAKTEEDFAMLQQTYTELQKPVTRLMEMSADEVIRAQKDSWDKARWDEAARKRNAVAETKAEVAMKMLRDGLAKDAISRYTGLSIAEIEALVR